MGYVALSAPVLTLLISALFTRYLIRPTALIYILDHPNDRSLHANVIPRTGGVAIVLSLLLASLFLVPYSEIAILWPLGLSLLLIAVVSAVDDRFSIPVLPRFAAHIAAGTGAILFAPWVTTPTGGGWVPVAGFILSVTLLVWAINLYNFMDGIDGLAGGMGVLGFAFFAYFGTRSGHLLFAQVSAMVAAASLGFLLFNFSPARIFMGDTGSASLGFLFGVFSLWGWHEQVFPIWVPLLVFSPFIVDASVTLIRRVWIGEKPWQAHKTHYYQRLVQLGWGHRKTALAEYGIVFLCGISAMFASISSTRVQLAIIVGWIIIYGAVLSTIDRVAPVVRSRDVR